MFFEDARELAFNAARLLESQKDALGCPELKVWPVAEFQEYAKSQGLTREEKEIIVDQAILVIDQFYAHLPFKRARYAAEPVQRLRLVRAQIDDLTDLAFHDQMIRAFINLRDAHTFYGLPRPFRGSFAFLPFSMKSFYEAARNRRFVVSKVIPGFEHPRFRVNAEIVTWNGLPVERAVEQEGESDPGGNLSSRFARGLNRICNRTLALTVPPQQNYVVLEYLPEPGATEAMGIVLPWAISSKCIYNRERQGTGSSINESMAEMAQARRMLFDREHLIAEKRSAWANGPAYGTTSNAAPLPAAPPEPIMPVDLTRASKFPGVFAFQYTGGTRQEGGLDPAALHDPANPDKRIGYLRIRTFDLDSNDEHASDRFVEEFRRITTLMQENAPDGLIVDVRSNPGGVIDAAERILQFLTPAEIVPSDFHFISSLTTQRIAAVLNRTGLSEVSDIHRLEWAPWIDDLMDSVLSGSVMTTGRRLTNPEAANDTGQIYQGPVTLLTDALAYSATDIFAAGFQDHAIGTIIGVDDNTGGGGANRWLHRELCQNLKLNGLDNLPLRELPAEAQIGLAIRRSSRVANNAGNILEDVGVRCDLRYHVTLNDLLNHEQDLLGFACTQLGAQPVPLLKIVSAEIKEAGIELRVETRNLFRIECLVNNQPQYSFSTDVHQPVLVPTTGLLFPPPVLLRLKGYRQFENDVGINELQLAATAIVRFKQPADEPAVTATTA